MTRSGPHTAYVVDDEPLARRRLRGLISETTWLECVGEAGSARMAIPAIDDLRPDLAFVDIKMPGMTGLEMLTRLNHRPVVIFTTAFDSFAVTAFEVGAVDYLLKPFGRARFQTAVERVRAVLGSRRPLDVAGRAEETLAARPLTRLFVRQGVRVVPVPLEHVERFQACDDYVIVHAGEREYTLAIPMTQLEQRLDATTFVRVHRSSIVNLTHVVEWQPYDGSRLRILLRSGVALITSRQRSRRLRELGL
ncbi:MAG: LytTR family DNA-binding domain-containing protein [Vicinamibacterales bacterium]